jgi:hypothetical protein
MRARATIDDSWTIEGDYDVETGYFIDDEGGETFLPINQVEILEDEDEDEGGEDCRCGTPCGREPMGCVNCEEW